MSTTLPDTIGQLTRQLDELLEVMQSEKQALSQRDVELLAASSERKAVLLEHLAPLLARDFQAEIAALQEPARSECDLLHKAMLQRARDVKDANLVNGKILHRSQNSVREILGILGGKHGEGLYGQSGQPLPSSDGERGAIAKA